MTASISAQPELYEADGGGQVRLRFLQCGRCQALTFPSSAYGCQHCGAPAANGRTVARPGPFVLRNAITIHAELSPLLDVPCVVAEIELAPGVVEEGVLTAASDAGLPPGTPLQAVAVPDARQPGQYLCRFQPLAAAGEAI